MLHQLMARWRRWLCGCLGLIAIAVILSTNLPAAEERGAIEGVIRFSGVVPAPQKIVTADGAVLMHSDLVVDAKTKGLRHVAVYLLDMAAQPVAKDAKPVVIDQRDMVFLPRVVVAQAGQKVRIENNDICNHAVNSVTTTTDNLFNVLTPMGQPFEFAFKAQKAPVQLGCALHPWMRAWVYVLPHRFAAVSDPQGRFKIEGLPPGKRTVQFAHPDSGLRETRIVEVTAGKAARIDIDWQAAKK